MLYPGSHTILTELILLQDDEDGENTACDEFAIGHFCDDIKAPFVEEGHDSASMTYDGGFNSGFSAVSVRYSYRLFRVLAPRQIFGLN